MKLGSSRGIKTGQWYSNEMMRSDDINFLNQATYQNITDLLASIAVQGVATAAEKNRIINGCFLEWSTVLTCYLRTGMAVSFKGKYLNADLWGYVASPGEIFLVPIDEDASIGFDSGSTYDRIDVLEIRPVQNAYNSLSRQFKDPISGLVTSANASTRLEYGFEFQILKGVGTSALGKEQTTFQVNSSTVGSNVAGKYVLFSTHIQDYYIWYSTGASTDPAISGRVGIKVDVLSGDVANTIAGNTRTKLGSAIELETGEIIVSGSTNQFIIQVQANANVTDATNGNMSTYFDTISITQGNGSRYSTAGWIKIAEVTVPASASSINQSNIKDFRDSDVWQNERYSTLEGESRELIGSIIKTVIFDTDVRRGDPCGFNGVNFEKINCNPIASDFQVTTNDSIYWASVCMLDSSHFAIAYPNTTDVKVYVRIGEISGSTISWTTSQSEFTTYTAMQGLIIKRVSDTSFIVVLGDNTSPYGQIRIGSYSGSSISWTTSTTAIPNSSTGGNDVCMLDSGYFAVNARSGSGYPSISIGHESGGSISWDVSSNQWGASTTPTLLYIKRLSNNTVMLVSGDAANGTNARVATFTAPSTITYETPLSAMHSIQFLCVAENDNNEFAISSVDTGTHETFIVVFKYDSIIKQIVVNEASSEKYGDDGIIKYKRQANFITNNILSMTIVDATNLDIFYAIHIYKDEKIHRISDWIKLTAAGVDSHQFIYMNLIKVNDTGKFLIPWRDDTNDILYIRLCQYVPFQGLAMGTVKAGNYGRLLLKGRLNKLSSLMPNFEYYADFVNRTKTTRQLELKIGKALSSSELIID